EGVPGERIVCTPHLSVQGDEGVPILERSTGVLVATGAGLLVDAQEASRVATRHDGEGAIGGGRIAAKAAALLPDLAAARLEGRLEQQLLEDGAVAERGEHILGAVDGGECACECRRAE